MSKFQIRAGTSEDQGRPSTPPMPPMPPMEIAIFGRFLWNSEGFWPILAIFRLMPPMIFEFFGILDRPCSLCTTSAPLPVVFPHIFTQVHTQYKARAYTHTLTLYNSPSPHVCYFGRNIKKIVELQRVSVLESHFWKTVLIIKNMQWKQFRTSFSL